MFSPYTRAALDTLARVEDVWCYMLLHVDKRRRKSRPEPERRGTSYRFLKVNYYNRRGCAKLIAPTALTRCGNPRRCAQPVLAQPRAARKMDDRATCVIR